MKALYYSILEGKKVQCTLCPHNCILKEGQTGICRVRTNSNGELLADTFNIYSSIGFDPIEKKPLYHYFPGKEILSVGSFGCNLHCRWCQNCEISQTGIPGNKPTKPLNAKELLRIAIEHKNNIGIAYTYNEPSIAFETNIETAKLFRENGLKNVMVSNGYINQHILLEYLKFIDAFNLDIKAFNPQIHKKFTGAELEIILDNAKTIFESGAHIELTYLVVPEVNDCDSEFIKFIKWIKKELSREVPLHISRYFPRNVYQEPPTEPELLNKFASIAKNELEFVYLGNIPIASYTTTICPICNSEIIKRDAYTIEIDKSNVNGFCSNCGKKIFSIV